MNRKNAKVFLYYLKSIKEDLNICRNWFTVSYLKDGKEYKTSMLESRLYSFRKTLKINGYTNVTTKPAKSIWSLVSVGYGIQSFGPATRQECLEEIERRKTARHSTKYVIRKWKPE